MAERTFLFCDDVNVKITVSDDGGDLCFTIEVLDDGANIADLRGFFFNYSGLPDDTVIDGDDVTETGFDTRKLGNGNNLNGASKNNFDAGVSFGEPGIGQGDDIRTTTFKVNSDTVDFSVDELDPADFGLRLTSVGEEGGKRDESLKLIGAKECIEEEVCEEYTIDFEEFTQGQVISEIDVGAGITVAVLGEENSDAVADDNDAMVFDTDNITGGDTDLAGGSGNVLIITEDDDAGDPDDSANGGQFTFEFSEAVDLKSITIIDTEEGGLFEAFDENGKIGELDISELNDGDVEGFDLDAFDDVTHFVVTFNGSGALDDLVFEVCRTETVCDCDLVC